MKRLIYLIGICCLILPVLAQPPNITEMEYYLDVDPGFGSGTAISITAASSQDLNVTIPAGSLSAGFHVLVVRAKDANGVWGQIESHAFFVASSTSESRPQITEAEYFLDTDPGQGNGDPITITAATDIDLMSQIPTTSLSAGFHTLYARVKDAAGQWCAPERQPFFISKNTGVIQTNINVVEYFIDNDPGQGLGTAVTFTPDTNVELMEMIPTTSLSQGFHTLYFRVQDDVGQWSSAEHAPFYISQTTSEMQVEITAAEYFTDLDPGQGNGTALTFTAGTVIDITELISTTSLTPGFHTLHFRVQDATGQWSTVEHAPFFISNTTSNVQSQITAVEYFLDIDPGPGNATALTFTPDTNIDLVEQIPTAALDPGFHTLHFRVQDATGQWSTVEQEPFYIGKSTHNVQTELSVIEYFIDVDPGQGNGTSVAFTTDIAVDLTTLIPIVALNTGFHTLYFRVQDATGQWSAVESEPFFIDISRKITMLEYALGDDPGVGNATQVVIDPAIVEIDELITVSTAGLAAGDHELHVRVLDDQQSWGITKSTTVSICSGAIADFSVANACVNNPVDFTDLSQNALGTDVYNWDFDSDGTIDDTTVGTVSHTYTSTGTFTATLTLDRANCVSTKSVEVVVNELPTVMANATETDICAGTEIILSGSGTETYAWDNDVEDGISFVPAETTTYTVTGTDANGCQNTASVEVVVNVIDPPTISIISDEGEHGVVLESSSTTGNQWFVDEAPVAGATDQTFTIFEPTTISVQVTDGDCMSAVSEEIYFYVLEADEQKITNAFKVWPNPAKNKLFVRSDMNWSKEVDFQITDASGQLLVVNSWSLSGKKRLPAIDVQNLQPGLYFLVVHVDQTTLIKKFIKN